MSVFNVDKKINSLKKLFHESSDFASRTLDKNGVKLGFVYLKSIIDGDQFSMGIFEPIQTYTGEITFDNLIKKVIRCNDVKEVKEEEVIENILKGGVIILLEGQGGKFLNVDILSYPTRMPAEPPTSPVIQGPREGFVEDLKTNITLLRRSIQSKDLVLKSLKVGRY